MDRLSQKQTILIVDDAKENINLLAEYLRDDFKIRVATSGEKALEIIFSTNPPDLVLLDVVMSDIDGYEVCLRAKQSSGTKEIPIIFVTGNVSAEDEVHGFSLGAVDYISKPFNPVVVKARVNTHAELKRYRDYLESISYLDGLTGIANRRKFDEVYRFMWNLSIRQQSHLAIIMMDIDYFKAYNDNYGHQMGDACLVRVAKGVSEMVRRKTDLAARYGGEEFACILSDCDLENAVIIAEKIRENILAMQIPHAYSPTEKVITISLGVAACVADRHQDCGRVIQAADQALYQSKQKGRNQVNVAVMPALDE